MRLNEIVVTRYKRGFQEWRRWIWPRERNIPVFGDRRANRSEKRLLLRLLPRQGDGTGRVRTETRFQSPRSTHGEKPEPRESSESRDSEGPVLRSLYAVYRHIIPTAYVRLHLPMHCRVAMRVLFSTILGIELITLLSRGYAPRELALERHSIFFLSRTETFWLPSNCSDWMILYVFMTIRKIHSNLM